MLYSIWRLYLLHNTLGVLSHTLSYKSLYILKTEIELSTISSHDTAKLICSETINLSNGIKKNSLLNSSWVKQEIQSYIIKHLKGTTNKNTTGQNLPVIYIFFPLGYQQSWIKQCSHPYNHYHHQQQQKYTNFNFVNFLEASESRGQRPTLVLNLRRDCWLPGRDITG